jgi:hypothetical protein
VDHDLRWTQGDLELGVVSIVRGPPALAEQVHRTRTRLQRPGPNCQVRQRVQTDRAGRGDPESGATCVARVAGLASRRGQSA